MSIFNTQFLKFLLVGGMNTLVGYMVFSLFLFLNFHFTLASFFALIFGILFNFKTHGRLVFGSRDNTLVFRYIISWGIIYLIAVFCLAGFKWFGVNLYLANALLIPPLTILAYFINLKFVFQEARPWMPMLKK
jgi:putative flippase GtrA